LTVKEIARQFVAKVGPLEHSKNSKDRKAARKAEMRLRKINRSIPRKRMTV
jgi:hypothetical protein